LAVSDRGLILRYSPRHSPGETEESNEKSQLD
jgi:hypothetical protein